MRELERAGGGYGNLNGSDLGAANNVFLNG